MIQHHTSIYLILCLFILEFCTAETNYNITCTDETYKIYPNDIGMFTLFNENLTNLEQCRVKVKLVEKSSYYNKRNEKVDVEVSLISDGRCTYSVDIYIGNPSKNKKITTLDCENQMTWRGQWPSMDVILDYHFNNVSDVVTSVQFRKCRNCYDLKTHYSQKKKEITSYHREQTHTFDPCKYYEMSLFSVCRNVFKFRVKDDSPLCFEIHNTYSFKKKDNDCVTTISIDNEPVLEISYNNWKPWCIPWKLKGKTVGFNVEKNGESFCLCTVKIRTNGSHINPSQCQRKYQTTTKDWYPPDDNNWDTDDDKSDEGENVEIIAIFTAIGIVGMFTCVCCCAAQKNRDGGENGEVTTEGRSNPPRDIYRMKALTTEDGCNQAVPSAPSASSYPLLPQQLQQGWPHPNQAGLHNTGGACGSEYESNDSLGRRGYHPPYEDSRYQRPEGNIPSHYNAQLSPHIHDMGSHSPHVNSTGPETEQVYDLSPPPSYEEVIKQYSMAPEA